MMSVNAYSLFLYMIVNNCKRSTCHFLFCIDIKILWHKNLDQKLELT